ncbi:hypothetical protein A2U01_0029834, partial [Trifolium medium]|nr:hypothetical protein [Trifolium medium]
EYDFVPDGAPSDSDYEGEPNSYYCCETSDSEE